MPLLNIIGLTSLNTSFYIAFGFIKSKQEGNFTWVLQQLATSAPVQSKVCITDWDLALMNAINKVFPDTSGLLCQWHIQQNIVAKCKKHFAGGTEENDPWTTFQQQWAAVMQSRTPNGFEESWQKMKEDYRVQIIAVSYIESTWIPWKEKFVLAWTHRSMHYGTVVTFRVESAHSALKRYLEVQTS